MKVVILAGGSGTRLSEYTKSIPKPMVKIGDKPILVHIMKLYAKYGFKEFIIALGYKGNLIKKYFKKKKFNWNIKLVDTGLNTMTGGRLKRLKKIIGNQRFLMTYGDGISNINLKKLLRFHIKNNKLVTLAAVRPPARFGAIKLNGNLVNYFKEKSKLDEGWINGGFFVINSSFFKILTQKNAMLEREPIQKVVKINKAAAYEHKGFWYCMDNLRDKNVLEDLLKKKKAPWIKK